MTTPAVTAPHEITDTGLIRMFPSANRPAEPIRSALNVLGHFSLLLAGVTAAGISTVSSVLGGDALLASAPATLGAYVFLGFVARGIARTSYRYALYGLVYITSLIAVMLLAERCVEAGAFAGGAYLCLGTLVACWHLVTSFETRQHKGFGL